MALLPTPARLAAGAAVVALPLAGLAALPADAARGDVRATVTYVVDGDTVHARIGSRVEKIRVIGVDTPELKGRQCFAAEAKAQTTRLVGGRSIRLRADRTQPDRDRYGRLLRHVVLNDGGLLAERLIVNGFGRELTVGRPYAGQAKYRASQARAAAKHRGLWGRCGSSVTRPRPAPAPKPAPASCTIKGNIASDGERIYHVPGQRYYDVTKIDTSKGERWFCSRTEAERAGWRPAKA